MPSDTVQYALLGLIASRVDGSHGYQLKTDFESLYSGFWSRGSYVNLGWGPSHAAHFVRVTVKPRAARRLVW